MHTLEGLNIAPAAAFVQALDGVFEHANWVAEHAARGRPFATVSALHDALMASVRAAPEGLRLAFLRGHPELSRAALAGAGLTEASRAEQTGLGLAALGDDAAAFEAGAREYREKFAIPFIVCVNRHTARSVLGVLRARLGSEFSREQASALDEIAHITRLRLVARVSGPGAPPVHGHLSTHVLDTARGKPAKAVRIVLCREGVSLRDAVTNDDGRVDGALLEGAPLRMGRYELRFHLGAYFSGVASDTGAPNSAFYDEVPVCFVVTEPEGRYHVPLLVTPWSYSTYRGS